MRNVFLTVALLGSLEGVSQTPVDCASALRGIFQVAEESNDCSVRAIGNQIGISANEPATVLAGRGQRENRLGEGSIVPMHFSLSSLYGTATYKSVQTHGHRTGTWSTTGVMRIDRATGQIEMRNTTWNNGYRRVMGLQCFRGSNGNIIARGFNTRDQTFIQLSFNPPEETDICPI